MNKERHTNRKWILVKWRLAIDAVVILGSIGLALMLKSDQPAIAMMIAGFADMTANYATYMTTNVVQKSIISKNYRPELAETKENGREAEETA